MKSAVATASLLAVAFIWSARTGVGQDKPAASRPESSGFEETSRYDDVLHAIDRLLVRGPLLRVERFGRSHEGRSLPLMILADPPVASPREARGSGRTVVFLMANIHGGEVEGKEASLVVAERLLRGDLRPLLRSLIVLIAPIYNADGNEKISLANRPEQNGPIGGVGVRENAQGLDLNRDFMKLDAPETRALVRLFNRWDPHVTVDLHTTNGSYHGYHLTYSIPLNPSVDPRILAFERAMMPGIGRAVRERHQYRTYYYGNFREMPARPGEPPARSWVAFTHQPRIGQNYVGLRNRLAILSEAYSYLDFRGRIAVTESFVEEILRFVAGHAAEVAELARSVDDDAARGHLAHGPASLGVSYEIRPLPEPVEILVGAVSKLKNPRSGREMTVMRPDIATPTTMRDYGMFAATRSVVLPRAYLFADEPGLRGVVERLRWHGIAVEVLTEPLTVEVERFAIERVERAARPAQGHREVRLLGTHKAESVRFPAGTFLVRHAQPLGTLAAYLLEPESDDGFATWNLLDGYLDSGKTYPIARLFGDVNVVSRLIDE
jgi:hypothetical protein